MRAIAIGCWTLGMVLGCGGLANNPVDTPPIVSGAPPVVVANLPIIGPDCVSFCNQSAICFIAAGKSVGPDESNCEASCQPGGE